MVNFFKYSLILNCKVVSDKKNILDKNISLVNFIQLEKDKLRQQEGTKNILMTGCILKTYSSFISVFNYYESPALSIFKVIGCFMEVVIEYYYFHNQDFNYLLCLLNSEIFYYIIKLDSESVSKKILLEGLVMSIAYTYFLMFINYQTKIIIKKRILLKKLRSLKIKNEIKKIYDINNNLIKLNKKSKNYHFVTI